MKAREWRCQAEGCTNGGIQTTQARLKKWCSEECRKSQYARPCPECGTPMNGSDGFGEHAPTMCAECRRYEPHSLDKARAAAERARAASTIRWPDEAILSALRAAASDDGLLSVTTYRRFSAGRRNMPSAPTVVNRFGTWNEAVSRAGLVTQKTCRISPYERMTDDEMLDAVARCADHLEGVPSSREYDAWQGANWAPSLGLLRIRFGGWADVLAALEARDRAAA